MGCALGTISADNCDGNIAAHGNQITIGVFRNILVTQLNLTVEIAFDERRIRNRRRTTNVEGTHCQLRARFTDGLGGNHTDRFTNIDRCAARQIANWKAAVK